MNILLVHPRDMTNLYGSKIFQNDLVRVKIIGTMGWNFFILFFIFGHISILLVHPRDMTNLYGSKIFQNDLVRVKKTLLGFIDPYKSEGSFPTIRAHTVFIYYTFFIKLKCP